MDLYFLSKRSFLLVTTAFLLLFFAGCGGGGEDEDGVSVETSSLSKAEFIGRADSLCKAGRSQFDREFNAFAQKNKPKPTKPAQEAWIGEVVEKMLLPTYEKLIDQISALGAPKGDKEEVTAFLNSLQQRLGEIEAEPTQASRTTTPFAKAAKYAKSYGLDGCVQSLG